MELYDFLENKLLKHKEELDNEFELHANLIEKFKDEIFDIDCFKNTKKVNVVHRLFDNHPSNMRSIIVSDNYIDYEFGEVIDMYMIRKPHVEIPGIHQVIITVSESSIISEKNIYK